MSWNVDPESILSPQEMASLKLAEEIYSARGKLSADRLAQVIGLDEETREKFVGAIGLILADVDFESRREVSQKMDEAAARFDEIIAILGGTASSGGLVRVAEAEAGPVVVNELNPTQKTWLGRLYDEKGLERIEAAGPEQRSALANQLEDIYINLGIARLGPDAKAQRAAQMKALLAGKNLHILADELGINYQTLYAGVMKMAESMEKRVPAIQLDKLLDEMESVVPSEVTEAVEVETVPEPDPNAAAPLRVDQERWLARMLQDDEPVLTINQMRPEQREQLIIRLSRRLNPALLRRFGKFSADQRVEAMAGFLRGSTVAGIAEERGVSEEAIRQELFHAADRLKATVPKEDLLQFVIDAQTYAPEED